MRVAVSQTSPPTSFTSPVSGRIATTDDGNGLATLSLDLQLGGGPRGAARVDLRGIPSGGGVDMTASGVSFVPATTRAVYTGTIVGLAGTDVEAVVRDASGDRLLQRGHQFALADRHGAPGAAAPLR